MAPLQSPEYAALVAAKEARDTAYARKQVVQDELLNRVSSVMVSEPAAREAVFAYQDAVYNCTQADADVTIKQAAFNTAYPAPTEVVDAVTAAQVARAELVHIGNELADSYTPAQLDLMNARDDAQTALDAAVTVAKALIEAAQVSPSKAFVVKRSTKAQLRNVYHLIRMIDQHDAPTDLIKVDEAALAKWVAKKGSVELDLDIAESVSVAFYAAKL